jgi:outer membrane receptor protein involved in Fe transport
MRFRPLRIVASPIALALAMQAVVAAEPEKDVELEEITVTGSRIQRDGYAAPTPLAVLSADELFGTTANSSLKETLQTLPLIAGGYNLTTGAGVPSFNQGGISSIEMRNLGINRTLVLLDGQRSVGSLATGVVDTDNFPQQLIERVEVVTGGAAAVYGSDAVAGVVNFILDRDFTGVKGEISGGQTQYGDADNYKIALTAGTPLFGGRGHLLLAGEVVDNNGVVDGVGKRDWGWTTRNYIVNPAYTATNGQPEFIIGDNVFLATATHGGLITFGPLRGTAFGEGGRPYQFNFGTTVARDLYMAGGDVNSTRTADAYSLLPSQERKNLFTRLSYDVAENFTVFGQWSRGLNSTYGIAFPHYLTASAASSTGGILVNSGNPFIPASVQTRMTQLGVTSFRVGTMTYDLPFVTTETSRATDRLVLGAEGKFDLFDRSWKWDGYAQYGRTQGSAYTHNARITSRFNQAIDAVLGPNGTIMCRSTLTAPNNGCRPFNAMGTGVNDQATLDWFLGTAYSYQTVKQDVYAMSVTGDAFQGWAGPISVALSAEHRKEAATVDPDPIARVAGWHSGNHQPLDAKTHVSEAAIELLVPLLSEQPFAESLDLNLAYRYTDYQLSGGVDTWKVGTTWTPVNGLRFRGTLSRDIRAPSISDLFQAQNFGLITTLNPWSNVPNQHGRTQSGSPGLTPEIADNFTLGMVAQPTFAPGLSFSVDYWKTDIKDAIALVSASQVISLCSQGWDELCGWITFDPAAGAPFTATSVITTVQQGNFNLAKQVARGVDFEASYRMPLSNISESIPGSMMFRLLGTRYITNETNNGITQATEAVGQAGLPELIMTGTLSYTLGNFTGALTGRYFDDAVIDNTAVECSSGCPTSTELARTYDEIDLSGATYFDASLSWQFNSLLGRESENRVFFNVRNIADKDPELTPGVGTTGLSYIYSRSQGGRWDKLGRTYRVGVEFKF